VLSLCPTPYPLAFLSSCQEVPTRRAGGLCQAQLAKWPRNN
jgi:hypothetical protein